MLRVSNPAARHWKTGARDALRVLEAGLAAPEGKRKPVFWGFVSGTDTLIQEAKKLGLDPRPFEAVAAVVYTWNHPYYTDEPLDRERLRAMFDTALAALPEIEEVIRRHEAKQWAELAPRPIVPVVLNSRTHTTNGAPPATTSLPEHTTLQEIQEEIRQYDVSVNGESTSNSAPASSDLVTLNQAAALAHQSKRTLERCKAKGTLPEAAVKGGDGRADLWDWRTFRPWLEKKFGRKLPHTFPANLPN
jgi:hypothetical protein